MSEFQGKLVRIVGDDELGRGVAKRFEREGAAVSLLHAEEAGARAEALDILVVNTLGQAQVQYLEAVEGATVADALRTVEQAFIAIRAALAPMQAQSWGRIIVIGHRYGEAVNEGIAAYNAAAWALTGLVRSAAMECGRWGIACNLLHPFADTADLRLAREMRPKVIDLLIGQVPLRRAGDVADDIGAAVTFLAGDDAAFINGQTLYADGGQNVAGPVFNPCKFVR